VNDSKPKLVINNKGDLIRFSCVILFIVLGELSEVYEKGELISVTFFGSSIYFRVLELYVLAWLGFMSYCLSFNIIFEAGGVSRQRIFSKWIDSAQIVNVNFSSINGSDGLLAILPNNKKFIIFSWQENANIIWEHLLSEDIKIQKISKFKLMKILLLT